MKSTHQHVMMINFDQNAQTDFGYSSLYKRTNLSSIHKIMIALGVASYTIILTLMLTMIIEHYRISLLPIGICSTINSVGSTNVLYSNYYTAEVKHVALEDNEKNVLIEVTLLYPPPPLYLNLKKEANVRSWLSSVASTEFVCHYDINSKEAWTDPIDIVGSVTVIIITILIILMACVWYIKKS